VTGVDASSLGRSLRVIAGEGMLTPRRPMTVRYRDGTEERLLPNRHRFAPEDELVTQAPEKFRLCMPKGDRTDAPEQFRAALRAADREVTRRLAEARGERLPARPKTSTGDEPWRL
jgi:hypothetical protein